MAKTKFTLSASLTFANEDDERILYKQVKLFVETCLLSAGLMTNSGKTVRVDHVVVKDVTEEKR